MLLPEWGNFFLEVGIALATYENPQKRVTIGLALPTRAYAASLISVGVTIGNSLLNHKTEATKRFQHLCTLQRGTPLIYRKNGKIIKVLFDGPEEIHGDTKLRLLCTEKERHWITSKQALDIEFPTKGFSSLLKRPSRSAHIYRSRFLASLLDTGAATLIASQSALDSLTIGYMHRLKSELQETAFAAKTHEGFVSGTLQDIVRVRKFTQSTETYRSDIYYLGSKECERTRQEIPTVIIFDGTASFLKWREYWRQSHWVVVLDQTELDFDIAVQTLNDTYVRSAITEREIAKFPTAPTIIPTIMYQETRQ